MGGKPDWMYIEERQHIENMLKERWKDECWAKQVRNIKTAVWIGIKKDDIFPEVPGGVDEALCFDDDLLDESFTLWVRIYQDGIWGNPMKFTGNDIPFIRKQEGEKDGY